MTTGMQGQSRARGFTLMELMITVAIIAILGVIAIPSYGAYVLRANRTVAKGALSELASRQESYFVERKRYATTLKQLSGLNATTLFLKRDGALVTSSSSETIYQISLTSLQASCPATGSAGANAFTLVAVPIQAQLGDTACGTLCLTSSGARSASSGAANCWSR